MRGSRRHRQDPRAETMRAEPEDRGFVVARPLPTRNQVGVAPCVVGDPNARREER
jgi:hypothetical protein